MNAIKELEDMVLTGKMTRRDFIARVAALGAAAALSPALFSSSALASVPKKG